MSVHGPPSTESSHLAAVIPLPTMARYRQANSLVTEDEIWGCVAAAILESAVHGSDPDPATNELPDELAPVTDLARFRRTETARLATPA